MFLIFFFIFSFIYIKERLNYLHVILKQIFCCTPLSEYSSLWFLRRLFYVIHTCILLNEFLVCTLPVYSQTNIFFVVFRAFSSYVFHKMGLLYSFKRFFCSPPNKFVLFFLSEFFRTLRNEYFLYLLKRILLVPLKANSFCTF